MKKEIVTGERLGFNNLSQDLRDVFVHGLRKDDEGKFRQVLNSIAADSQRVSITDERGHFKPKTNEEIFTQLISLTAKAALFEADGGDTHSSEYYALIKKTDVDLTRKLESVWANRDRQVEVSESRVAAKAWGKSSVEKGAEAVIDDLLNRADKWVNLTLIDNLVAAYDNRLSKAAAGTVVVSEIVTLLAGCNPPPAEVQEIQSPQQISGVVTREILTKIAADPKNQEVAAYVKDDMDRILADFNGRFIPGTEMLYYIDNGGKMTRWVFGAEAREDGQMGVKVLGYCNDSDECQVVDKAFLTKEKDGAKVYGYVDEAGNSHGVIAYVGEDTYAFDYEGNSHSDNRDNGKNLLDAIMSIGVTSVQAAAEGETAEATMEATAVPTEVVDNEKIQKEEIAKNINEFLNSEGKFSLESFQANSQYFFGESDLKEGELPLGMVKRSFGQFILLGSQYDENSKIMHLYLGATDINKNRVAFDFNFKKNIDRTVEPPVGLQTIKSSLYSMSSSDAISGMLDGRSDWDSFLKENMFKPISLSLMTESYVEIRERNGKKSDKWIYGYDDAMDFRIALYSRLGKYGEAVDYNPEKVLDDETINKNLICFWTGENFNGVDSLSITNCPTNNYLFETVIRRP